MADLDVPGRSDGQGSFMWHARHVILQLVHTPAPSHLNGGHPFAINYSVVVSICALVFTVAGFWWINARRGRLKSFEPRSFAAAVSMDETILRFPLVLYNTGAEPIVVQDLRLNLPQEPDHIDPFPWRASTSQIQPINHESVELPAVFAVAGRVAEQTFMEFDGLFPGTIPEPRAYSICVEAKLSHRRKWRKLTSFVLHAEHIGTPEKYVAYSNNPDALTPAEKESARQALQEAAKRFKKADS